MANKQPLVTIKGKKDGLILSLDDRCSFEQLIAELKTKLSVQGTYYHDDPLISVKVEAGNRYLTEEDRKEIHKIIREEKQLFVAEISSNVFTAEQVEEKVKQQQLTTLTQYIRSGQEVRVDGDILLIGDVNPGGKIIATGNIYVMGALRGIAHAGYSGQDDKVITASLMKPSQLMIADVISRDPDPNGEGTHVMEFAYVDHNTGTISVDRLQSLFRRSLESTKRS
ncbi:septum site-determining protein MinC [Pullulanibacillus pueri]|uniref:Probable septum site-determining protein MinC n=1 Tax=Pullulanibacillus pueri TaxID=1437324 RepID=A0A8J2ZYD1_9BACL|nr:septum site-determining protein MinC [Pullulanibacillus pueri]MBM7683289.1 septum site-determining protein MinC [Pullulanibacillus pueri]GGH85844.1 putative septum site-determining protein MinC [Pullulanibacillus pueri]